MSASTSAVDLPEADDPFAAAAHFFATNPPPANFESIQRQLKQFLEQQPAPPHRLVLVTSGGTTVPLERNTVRFIDNFSSGLRGAASAEAFLAATTEEAAAGARYSVIYLHRESAVKPFERHVEAMVKAAMKEGKVAVEDGKITIPLETNAKTSHYFGVHAQQLGSVSQPFGPAAGGRADAETSSVGHSGGVSEGSGRKNGTAGLSSPASLSALLSHHSHLLSSHRLLLLPFTSIVDYFYCLKLCCELLAPWREFVMLYSAAAVSDYYMPWEKMSVHKLQSREVNSVGEGEQTDREREREQQASSSSSSSSKAASSTASLGLHDDSGSGNDEEASQHDSKRQADQSLQASSSKTAAVSQATAPQKAAALPSLHLSLPSTPKLLPVIRRSWLPSSFLVSFKLETDLSILIGKARNAVMRYGMDLVVANELQTRHEKVWLVGKDEAQVVQRDEGQQGEEKELEGRLIRRIVKLHQEAIDKKKAATA